MSMKMKHTDRMKIQEGKNETKEKGKKRRES
jgi:hypothetical protein